VAVKHVTPVAGKQRGKDRFAEAPAASTPAQSDPCSAMGELDNSKGVGPAPKGDFARQFPGLLHRPGPVKRFDVVTLALENDLATLPVSFQMLTSQHEFTPVNPGQSPTASRGRPLSGNRCIS
jgi:hypothetical protein